MEVGVYSSSGKEHLSLTPRRKSDQDFGSRYALLLKKADQEHKVITQSKATEVGGAYSVSAKENLYSNLRLRSQQEFNSRPAPQLNQKKIDQEHKAINQSKVMDGGGAYSVGAKEHLSSNPRRRSQKGFDSRPTLNQNKAQDSKANQPKVVAANKLKPVWDCGSSLYDSFELDSFKRQLDSAISCRTMSMPHLSDRRAPPPPPPPQPATITASSKKPSSNKLSRSIQKLLRSVFKPNTKPSNSNNSGVVFKVQDHQQANTKDGFYVVYNKTGALTTIPEVVPHEFDFGGLSPEIGAFVRRTGSERFTATSTANIGISCA